MSDFLKAINSWLEVWPLLIPLIVILSGRTKFPKPLVLYVFIALPLSLLATIMALYHTKMPSYLENNNILYNLHSFARTVLFGWYIIKLTQVKQYLFAKFFLYLYILLVAFNFIFFENPFNFSVRLFAAESIVLLVLCITFFLSSILNEEEQITSGNSAFLICTGISIYEAISFFIYLFFYHLFFTNPRFGIVTLNISHYSFILLCVLLATAIYQSRQKAIQNEISR